MRCVRWMVRSGSTEARRECFSGRHWRTIGLGRRGPRRALRRRLCVFRRSTAAALVLAHTNKLPRPCARAGGDSDGPLVRVARRLARQCCKRLGAKRLGYMSVLKYRDLSRGEISESSALFPSVGPLVAWRAAATCTAAYATRHVPRRADGTSDHRRAEGRSHLGSAARARPCCR